jgi:hypothetical protein
MTWLPSFYTKEIIDTTGFDGCGNRARTNIMNGLVQFKQLRYHADDHLRQIIEWTPALSGIASKAKPHRQ